MICGQLVLVLGSFMVFLKFINLTFPPNFNLGLYLRHIIQLRTKYLKYLVPILSNFCRSDYVVRNSSQFVEQISTLKIDSNCCMASFDVENLFGSIPLYETIDICLDLCFGNESYFLGMDRPLFKKNLECAVGNSFFNFNGKFYKQTDGLEMGLPLSPTFADIFMSFHEKIWLDSCPSEFKPIFIDVTLMIPSFYFALHPMSIYFLTF